MGKSNSKLIRTDPEFYRFVKEVQRQKFIKSGKIMPLPQITRGIMKWKETPSLKKALIDEWK